ncbi:1534_t:CDS:10, partial [Entrophospora sp. SA101]
MPFDRCNREIDQNISSASTTSVTFDTATTDTSTSTIKSRGRKKKVTNTNTNEDNKEIQQNLRRSSRIKSKQNIEKVDNTVISSGTDSTAKAKTDDIDPASIAISTDNNDKVIDLEKFNNVDNNITTINTASSNTIIAEEEVRKPTNKRKKSDKSDESTKKKTKKQDEKQIAATSSSSSSANNNAAQTDEKKRARLNEEKDKEPEEKRLAKFRPSCSMKVKERIERAMSQRMFLVDRSEVNELHHEFVVLGSVGNVYNIEISTLPKCNCPDFAVNGNFCKHILFVYLKVLRVNPDSNYIYQKALLTSELRQIFQNAAPNPTVLASQKVRDQYAKIIGGVDSSSDDVSSGKRPRQPIEGDCPICYETLLETEKLVWCKDSCGNNVHEVCFNQWKSSKHSSGNEITCVYCRNKWEDESKIVPSSNDGYINLGEAQGISGVRESRLEFLMNDFDEIYNLKNPIKDSLKSQHTISRDNDELRPGKENGKKFDDSNNDDDVEKKELTGNKNQIETELYINMDQ